MNWKVEGRGDSFAVTDDNDIELATISYEELRGVEAPDSTEFRRARLIAAAPELLAALEALIDAPDDDSRYNAALDARAVITKATAPK